MKIVRADIRSIFREAIVSAAVGDSGKTELHVFDFDDTIVNTRDSSLRVKVTHTPEGGESTVTLMTSEEFANQPLPTSGKVELDFSDFDTVPSDIELKPHFEMMKQSMANPNAYVMILTARAASEPVREFLHNLPHEIFPDELGVPDIVGVGNSDPKAKSDYVKDLVIDRGFSKIFFYDDAIKNVKAIASLEDELDGVEIDVQQVEESASYLRESTSPRDITRSFLHGIKF